MIAQHRLTGILTEYPVGDGCYDIALREGGVAVSTRSTDVRVAQQLSMLGSLPPLAILALMSLNVITVSTGLAVGLAAALLAVDPLAWRVVAAMFDRERLVTGRRA